MNKLIDLLSKYQKIFLGMAIFLSLLSVSVNITNGELRSIFGNYPALMLLFVTAAIIMGLIYIRIDKHRINLLSNQIIETSKEDQDDFQSLLQELTPRQKTVYDLIVAGRSNKEIMAELFIEQSTLKSHINQMYKKLKIKDRKELKSKIKH